jgi:hypothetical protein
MEQIDRDIKDKRNEQEGRENEQIVKLNRRDRKRQEMDTLYKHDIQEL